MSVQHPTLHWCGVPRTENNTRAPKRSETQRKKWCRAWSCCRWYQLSVTQDTVGMVECSSLCRLPHAPRTRLPQESVRVGTALHVSLQLSILRAVFPAARIASFNYTWLVFSGFPRSCVRGAVTRLWNHTSISPIPSSCRLCSTPRLSSKDHAASIPSSRKR